MPDPLTKPDQFLQALRKARTQPFNVGGQTVLICPLSCSGVARVVKQESETTTDPEEVSRRFSLVASLGIVDENGQPIYRDRPEEMGNLFSVAELGELYVHIKQLSGLMTIAPEPEIKNSETVQTSNSSASCVVPLESSTPN